jgi:hypothetical protein
MPRPGPARHSGAPAALCALVAGVALAACGTDPVAPDPSGPSSSYTAATPVRGQTARAFYGDSLLDWEQLVFFWNDRVNWTAQGRAVRADVAAARTHGGLWDAADASIDRWLRDAPPDGPDLHSGFFPPAIAPGVADSPPDTARRYTVVGDTLSRALAPGAGRVGYLWFPTYSGRTPEGRVDSTLAVIRAVDQHAPCGWVLDQRFNSGGDIAAMLLGLNPLLGDAPASATQNGVGGLVYGDDARLLIYVSQGEVGAFEASANRRYRWGRAATPYTPQRPNAPVAILIGPQTASAGELITFAFRGGAVPHRSFGANTYGVTTGPAGIYLLPDSGFLNITASVMFDRTGRLYGGILSPDEPVAGPSPRDLTPGRVLRDGDAVVSAAVRWLQAQPACTGAPAASRQADRERPAPASRLPGVAAPSPVHEHTSRYFLPAPARRPGAAR